MSKDKLIEKLKELKTIIPTIRNLNDSEFEEVITLWHEVVEQLKDEVYFQDPRNNLNRLTYEWGWGAQSINYMIDCIPEFHRILIKYYRRKDELTLLDVGIGSGAGTNIIALLHSDIYVYSKITVYGMDHVDIRKRWIKAMYPKINYFTANIYDIKDRKWDFVFCIAVLEHVPNPRQFCEKLLDLCKGFTFIYVPYNEINRIPSHINTFTEEFFKPYNIESLQLIKSTSWHPMIPEDKMMLVVINCRNKKTIFK